MRTPRMRTTTTTTTTTTTFKMVFRNEIYKTYNQKEQKRWKKSKHAKAQIQQGWYNLMLAEGISAFGENLTEARLLCVIQNGGNDMEVPLHGETGNVTADDIRPVEKRDTFALKKWSIGGKTRRRNRHVYKSALSRPQGGYAFSKFRFFRRMHFAMQTTVTRWKEFKESVDRSLEILGEADFQFEDFVDQPQDYTENEFYDRMEEPDSTDE
jgi:hypothetical protein